MNIQHLEEAISICRRACDSEGMTRSKREAYSELASKVRVLMETIEEQSSIFNNMIALAEETGNYDLCETLQVQHNRLNQENELLDELKRACNYVAEN